MGDFVTTPMPKEFVKDDHEGGPGIYDKSDCPPFGNYPRTPSPNAAREKFYEKSIPSPSGEADHFD